MILTTTNLITDGKKKIKTKKKTKKTQVIFSVNWTSKFLHALQESAKANMHINNKNR